MVNDRVRIDGDLTLTPAEAVRVLDDESKRATRTATKLLEGAISAGAPVGPTGRLKRGHRAQVSRTPFGYEGRIRRNANAWYGRIVEGGRRGGTAARLRPTGRAKFAGRPAPRVGRMTAQPFVRVAATANQLAARAALEAGADRAATRIAERLGRSA